MTHHGIPVPSFPTHIPEAINKLAKREYRLLDLNGYARLDIRPTSAGKIYVLQANPNAAIYIIEEVTFTTEPAGKHNDQLIQRLLNLRF